MSLTELIGVPLDDPKWDDFVDQLTVEEMCHTGFICGLLGVIFSAIFAVGCSMCGAGSAGYGCYGCIGGSCFAASDIGDSAEDFEDAMETLRRLEDIISSTVPI